MFDVSGSGRWRWACAIVVVSLALLALGLRLPGVATRSLWLDEAWRANIALAPTWQSFWDELQHPQGLGQAPIPPLWALALRLLADTVGRSAGALRILPLAASVAAVPLAYLVARPALGRAAGLAAATCFAVYPSAVIYGQELKPYSIDVMVVLVLLLCAERVARRPEPRNWVALTVASSLAPGFSYAAALVLPSLGVGLLASCQNRRSVLRWIVAEVVAAGAALGWYLAVVGTQRARPLVIAYWASGFPPAGASPFAWGGAQLMIFMGEVLAHPAWLFAAGVTLGYMLAPRWLWITAVGTFITVVLAAAFRLYPFAADRTSLFLVPLLYIPFATAVTRIATAAMRAPGVLGGAGTSSAMVPFNWWRTVRGLAVAATSVALLVFPARGSLHPRAGLVVEETAPLLGWLGAERRASDRVYVYYAAVPAFRFYAPEVDDRVTFGGPHRDDPAAYEAELRRILVPGERLWVLFSHALLAEKQAILTALTIYGNEAARRETEGAALHLFHVTRSPGTVRRLTLSPDDLRHPGRMRELFERRAPDTP